MDDVTWIIATVFCSSQSTLSTLFRNVLKLETWSEFHIYMGEAMRGFAKDALNRTLDISSASLFNCFYFYSLTW